MKLSAKGEYACLAMIELARHEGQGRLKAEQIATHAAIPRKFLEQILVSLIRAGYARSRRGAEGGYELAKPAKKISVADIVRLMDGALAPVESASRYFYSPTPSERNRALARLFKEIRDLVAEKMETTTLDRLV